MGRQQQIHAKANDVAKVIKEGSNMNLKQFIRSDLPSEMHQYCEYCEHLDTLAWKNGILSK